MSVKVKGSMLDKYRYDLVKWWREGLSIKDICKILLKTNKLYVAEPTVKSYIHRERKISKDFPVRKPGRKIVKQEM